MGDRALVQFKGTHKVSPVCYLHWNGTEAPEWIRECAELMKDRADDVDYVFARFVGICHSYIDGQTGLGAWNHAQELTEADSHGDAGCFLVDCKTWEVQTFGGYGQPFNATVNNSDQYRFENVQSANHNGRRVTIFTAYERRGDAYVHIGQFTAPGRVAVKDLPNHIPAAR